jgi:phosphoribosylanthranilate isomerase
MCGMTRAEDIAAACQAGADSVGMIFYPPSARFVSLQQASEISQAATLQVNRVALFVNPEASYVREVLDATKADIIQFHGDETPEFCQQFGVRYIKAFRVKSANDLQQLIEPHRDADAILLDAYVEGVPGGTGKRFDWSLTPDSIRDKLFLAGGLNSANVGQAITQVRPYTVDVAGGIEVEPGIKDVNKIFAFAEAVRQADRSFVENSS